jgi:hypothetical protein
MGLHGLLQRQLFLPDFSVNINWLIKHSCVNSAIYPISVTLKPEFWKDMSFLDFVRRGYGTMQGHMDLRCGRICSLHLQGGQTCIFSLWLHPSSLSKTRFSDTFMYSSSQNAYYYNIYNKTACSKYLKRMKSTRCVPWCKHLFWVVSTEAHADTRQCHAQPLLTCSGGSRKKDIAVTLTDVFTGPDVRQLLRSKSCPRLTHCPLGPQYFLTAMLTYLILYHSFFILTIL